MTKTKYLVLTAALVLLSAGLGVGAWLYWAAPTPIELSQENAMKILTMPNRSASFGDDGFVFAVENTSTRRVTATIELFAEVTQNEQTVKMGTIRTKQIWEPKERKRIAAPYRINQPISTQAYDLSVLMNAVQPPS